MDSTIIIKAIPDTLRVINLSRTPAIPLEYLGLIGVLLGATISIVGNIMLAKRQARTQIQNTFFLRRLEVYVKLAEMSWQGHSVNVKHDPGEPSGGYPMGYRTFQHLMDWLNSMVETIDQNRLLLDQVSYKKFDSLNARILADKDSIEALAAKGGNKDWYTRAVGRQSISDIQKLTEEFMDSLRKFLAATYKISLQKVQ